MNKFYVFLTMVSFFCFSFENVSFAITQDHLSLTSEAAILMDSKSGAILYEKNASKKMYPASLTKIATAIYAIENGNLLDSVTVSENAFNTVGTRVYLEKGEVVSLKHLLQGMLINSGNDAAVAIAEYMHGSVDSFSKNLNMYLQEKVGVRNTHFSNPHGLFAEDHYTTAEDLGRITNYAMKNEVFREIFGTKTLDWDGKSWDTTLISHHLMLKGELPYKEVTGGKTGYVSESKSTLATTADNGQIQLTAIVLKAQTPNVMYLDTKKLLDFGFQGFKASMIPETQEFVAEGKKFHPLSAVAITEPLSGVQFNVTEDGVLRVQTNDQHTIQFVQLNPEEIPAQPPANNESNKSTLINMTTFFGALVLVVAFTTLRLKRKKAI